MMYFSLHVTCSCIFMHTYLQVFIYFYIFCLVGAFLIVFLSPSLFLALVCTMTPKCKSTPSQNTLHFRASTSSSFDPTPSYVRFCDEKAHKDFLENFSRRGIHLEHQVILSDFSDTNLLIIIHSRGWSHCVASWSRALP